MATFKVIGKGEDGKYFDTFALTDVINYVVNSCKTPSNLIGTFGVRLPYAAQHDIGFIPVTRDSEEYYA